MANEYLLTEVTSLVQRYLTRFELAGWNRFTAFEWEAVRPELLTAEQLEALRTAMLVEDHIPGYSGAYHRLFALSPELPAPELDLRRQMLHFVFKWTSDEDRHAHTLENYLRATGRVDPSELSAEMRAAFVHPYRAPHLDAMQMAVYTVVQEKATQVFYARLRDACAEPVAKRVLDSLSQDEARHCGFFSDLLRIYLAAPGGVDVALIKEAVDQFKMPLYGVLDNYRRRSIIMMRAAAGYDFRDAFGLIEQALRRFSESRTDSRSDGLAELLDALEARSVRPAVARSAQSPR
ncbi:MAG: acyl-ACP desaturase [Elusimicrobia bacterium]|nr:acyl-ACP desaturase [Elusimicrobiota bacterium]